MHNNTFKRRLAFSFTSHHSNNFGLNNFLLLLKSFITKALEYNIKAVLMFKIICMRATRLIVMSPCSHDFLIYERLVFR